MSNKEILPRNKQLEFHAARNLGKTSRRLTKVYERQKDSFVNKDLELCKPVMFLSHSALIASTMEQTDTKQAHQAAYQGMFFAIALTNLLYSADEHPEIELRDDIANLPPEQLQKFIEDSTQEFLIRRQTLSNLIDSHMKRIDPPGEHPQIASTAAAFVLMQIEDTYREDHRVTINGQFEEMTRNFGPTRRVSENDVG